tara:strand:- start:156 stop:989 length:834 start_codon:yes stop_codon:yes gene_type:complete
MKIRHNKKRNTAFIYESLIKEATACMLKNDTQRQKKIALIVKKHFDSDSILRKHLECYRSLYESTNLDNDTAQKILIEAKIANRLLDPDGLFVSQSDLIDDVNKELEPAVYNTFVPNYKTLATIDQIFSNKLSPKDTVILESQIIHKMTNNTEMPDTTVDIDNVVFSSFVDKFNKKYDDTLLQEQKTLLNYFISSFVDNSLSLKVFLNEEISRLKDSLSNALETDEIKNDSDMAAKTSQIIDKLQSFYGGDINEDVLLTVLKTQRLIEEIEKDGDNH